MSDNADRRLGELAVQAGYLGPRELARALRETREKGRPLAETLVEMKLLTAEQAHALGGGRLEGPPKPELMVPVSRTRRKMRVLWRRMSPHARVWLLVIALLVVLFALSIPLSLLRK